jgi:hypothetical protein
MLDDIQGNAPSQFFTQDSYRIANRAGWPGSISHARSLLLDRPFRDLDRLAIADQARRQVVAVTPTVMSRFVSAIENITTIRSRLVRCAAVLSSVRVNNTAFRANLLIGFPPGTVESSQTCRESALNQINYLCARNCRAADCP